MAAGGAAAFAFKEARSAAPCGSTGAKPVDPSVVVDVLMGPAGGEATFDAAPEFAASELAAATKSGIPDGNGRATRGLLALESVALALDMFPFALGAVGVGAGGVGATGEGAGAATASGTTIATGTLGCAAAVGSGAAVVASAVELSTVLSDLLVLVGTPASTVRLCVKSAGPVVAF